MNDRRCVKACLLSILLLGPVRGAAAQEAAPDCASAPAPSGSLAVVGPHVRVGERLIVGASFGIEVTALAGTGGPAQWTPLVAGREAAAWPTAWAAGEHRLSARLVDGCGKRGETAPLLLLVDAEPPALRWQVGSRRSFADRLAADREPQRRRLRGRVRGGEAARGSWESDAGVWQVPLPWAESRGNTVASRARYPVVIASDHPQAFLAAAHTTLAAGGASESLDDRILWIAADDAQAGVEQMTLRLRTDGGDTVLEVETADLVGNTARQEIVLRRSS